jgi:hypothetical protein
MVLVKLISHVSPHKEFQRGMQELKALVQGRTPAKAADINKDIGWQW